MASFKTALYTFVALFFLPRLALSFTPSTFLGPAFAPPKNLSKDPSILSANINFLSSVQSALSTGITTHGPFDNTTTAFSFEFFSAADPIPLYEYHYTPSFLKNTTLGVKSVDGDTIYRIGSCTKLLTVYTFLIADGDIKFNEPITKYVPELLAASKTGTDDPVNQIAWSEVTIGALASHMAGLGPEYGWLDISLADFPFSDLGLPELNDNEIPPCGAKTSCTRTQFLTGFAARDPVFATFHSPVYCNAAFQILAYALENMTGLDLGQMMGELMFNALNLTHTSFVKPDDTLGVIPGDANVTYWNYDLGELWPTGGVYSSTHDLSTIGRSILQSSLLSPSQTRRWIKPLTHTSSLTTSLGAPWEIKRLQLAKSGRWVDIYTKDGKLGAYTSYLVLIPDYDIGFTIFAAGFSLNADVLVGLAVDAYFDAVEEAARSQAALVFTGEYKVQSGSGSNIVNSSFTLTSSKENPGLGLDNWISNGTIFPGLFPIFIPLAGGNFDLAAGELALYENGQVLIDLASISIRLYPTGLSTKVKEGCKKVAYRAVFEIVSAEVDGDPIPDSESAWLVADAVVYGGKGADEFLFEVNKSGIVVGVEHTFTRQFFRKN